MALKDRLRRLERESTARSTRWASGPMPRCMERFLHAIECARGEM